MIRQAHTYLVSAMSGATLIAIAIAVFVVLVSAQVFRDWPIAALGDGGDAGVSKAKPVADAALTGAGGATAVVSRRAKGARTGAVASKPGRHPAQHQVAVGDGRGSDGGSTGTGTTTQPGAGTGSPAGGGNAAPQSPSSPSAPAASGGSGSGSASSGGGGQTGGGGSGGGGGGGGTGGGSTGGGSTSGSAPSTSGAVTETVNNTVNTVDEAALGGTLDSTGVTGVTEGVVNGVAGPESTVGKVVDETVNTVGKLLNGGH